MKQIFKRMEELEQEYIQFWIDICEIESPTDYKEGVDRVGAYVCEKAKARGWKIEVQKQEVSGDCICITMNPDVNKEPICCSSHMDTVHPLGLFGDNPVHMDEEKIYGPGVADCKGGIAAAFLAMVALEDCGYKERPIKLILQSDEETSSQGSNQTTLAYMCEQAKGSIAFLNSEPSRTGKVVMGRKGILRYRFEVSGKAAHAANCCTGSSAIRQAACAIVELEKMKDKDGITCNCGVIQGGTTSNTVPESCVFTIDVRFKTEEQMKQAQKQVEEIANTTYVEGTTTNLILESHRSAMEEEERNFELLARLNEIYVENDLPSLEWQISGGGSDAAYTTAAGIPTICAIGVLGGNFHGRDEFAWLSSMIDAAKRIVAAIKL